MEGQGEKSLPELGEQPKKIPLYEKRELRNLQVPALGSAWGLDPTGTSPRCAPCQPDGPLHGPGPHLGPGHLDFAPPAPSSVWTGAGQHVGADRHGRWLATLRGGAPP